VFNGFLKVAIEVRTRMTFRGQSRGVTVLPPGEPGVQRLVLGNGHQRENK